ncbi:ACP S-malonyltransferase [Chitinophaga nivalis]|uniref:[acyl-carrier-protein] S-malonyltransferase n=1 Tax=Chitinophaga nivalis TaxID=2991709 RepID=A0ABT3IKC6_9BACT|nr:ACP S-malonyltransferase [Chitinophaga nivalis]MCW3465910.1 ACP S-malonyltransferase [Chitinophaga nivalis]MCW3484399.1 ACP S-malonyltransferase [Chitinophaga nivalis]
MKAIMFPGQGSQYKGMGKDLFPLFDKETQLANEILGYDIAELCVKDPNRLLGQTAYTQPALYVVNALQYYRQESNDRPDYLLGHSLGEYNALLAAGAFDFETGLRLVQKRGALMAAASGGGMAAILGIGAAAVKEQLLEEGYTDIDVANYNTPTQTVIAGPQQTIDKAVKYFESKGTKAVLLFVSAPFHSRYMQPAADEFSVFLRQFTFSPLTIPVIANATAAVYADHQIAALLSRQIQSSVQWTDTIRVLMGKGVATYEEVGGKVLTKMVNEILEKCTPLETTDTAPIQPVAITTPDVPVAATTAVIPADLSARLGSQAFRDDYGVTYTYVAGAMYGGVASKEMVVRMANAGMIGFLGTGGLSSSVIAANIRYIQSKLAAGKAYGMNLLHQLTDPASEMITVDLFLEHGIKNIEAAGYMQITSSLVYYRLTGLRKDEQGKVVCDHRIIAKVSRPEVAEIFMRPAPEKIINKLLEEKRITAAQAALAGQVPMSHDICVEADSGGHTDRGIAMVLLPAIQRLRSDLQAAYQYTTAIRTGLAGGIGTPQAIACAYLMGADFVLTGSVNQCTVEAATSDTVKDLLQDINVQDTDYAPSGDLFEIGAKVQVLKKGVLFPSRANKLFTLYNQYESLEDIPAKTIAQLEKSCFNKPLAAMWEDIKTHLNSKGEQAEITRAEQHAKNKMALVFRWYFDYSAKLALEGNIDHKVNFQIQTGPALGAFNQWVKGTALENWRNRHVDEIGIRMMEAAAQLLKETLLHINN